MRELCTLASQGKLAELLAVALTAATRLNNALSHGVLASILLTAKQSDGFPPPVSYTGLELFQSSPLGSELERRSHGSDCGAEVAGPATPVGNTSCEVGTWPWKRGRGRNMPLMLCAAEW